MQLADNEIIDIPFWQLIAAVSSACPIVLLYHFKDSSVHTNAVIHTTACVPFSDFWLGWDFFYCLNNMKCFNRVLFYVF